MTPTLYLSSLFRRPRHSPKSGAYLSLDEIGTRVARERAAARREADAAAMDARTEVLPVVTDAKSVAVRRGVIVATDTLPVTRAELMGLSGVDGGRPLHELDHVQRYCSHSTSMYGRCAKCGMTWAEQADAMSGAR